MVTLLLGHLSVPRLCLQPFFPCVSNRGSTHSLCSRPSRPFESVRGGDVQHSRTGRPDLQDFPPSAAETLHPSHSGPPPPAPAAGIPLPVPGNLAALSNSCKWGPTAFVFLRLARLTRHDVLRVRAVRVAAPGSFPSSGRLGGPLWVDGGSCVRPAVSGHSGCSHRWAPVDNGALSTMCTGPAEAPHLILTSAAAGSPGGSALNFLRHGAVFTVAAPFYTATSNVHGPDFRTPCPAPVSGPSL